MLDLLQLAKEMVFGFIRQMTTSYKVIEKLSESGSTNERDWQNQKRAVDDFAMMRLEEAYKSFSEWLFLNFFSPLRTVNSLGDELMV